MSISPHILLESFIDMQWERVNFLIKAQIDLLSDNSYSWLEQSSNVLKLINKAPELFLAGTQEQKVQLINFVASNLVLSDKKVVFEYKEPSVLAAKIKTQNTGRPGEMPGRPILLRDQDSNLEPTP